MQRRRAPRHTQAPGQGACLADAARHARLHGVPDRSQAVADLVNGDPRGVVLGPSRGQLLSVLAECLNTRVWLGSEVVVSRLDDEANQAPWLRVADRGDV